jgi:hypothetical protein
MQEVVALILIYAFLVWIVYRLEVIMPTLQELLDKVNGISPQLADIRADIQKIKDQLNAGGLTAAETVTLSAALDEKLAEVKVLADENV